MENIVDCSLDLMEATKKALRDPATKKELKIAIAIETGPAVMLICGTSIPKFDLVGKAVEHAGQMVLDATPGVTIVGPVTRSLLPAMFKVKDHKEVPGVGMTHALVEKEGRKPLQEKDIKALAPVEAAAPDKGGEAKAGGGAGGGKGDAPAVDVAAAVAAAFVAATAAAAAAVAAVAAAAVAAVLILSERASGVSPVIF